MSHPDLDLARRRQRLRRVLALCESLCETLDDEYCRRKLRAVEEWAAELLSSAEPRARGALSGADFLWQRIRADLELVQSRLYTLERESALLRRRPMPVMVRY